MRSVLLICSFALLGQFPILPAMAEDAGPDRVSCTLEHLAMTKENVREGFELKPMSGDLGRFISFTGLNRDDAAIVGNAGSSPVRVFKRSGDGIWIAEFTMSGGLNIWTIFLREHAILGSKQYWFGAPIGVYYTGTCEW